MFYWVTNGSITMEVSASELDHVLKAGYWKVGEKPQATEPAPEPVEPEETPEAEPQPAPVKRPAKKK